MIEWSSVKRMLDECPPLDAYRGYYAQFAIPIRRLGPLVPKTRDVLSLAMRPEMRVLDIGCGRGDTLLDCAPLFKFGDGIDESDDVMITEANLAKARRGISNVQFQFAKAAQLPFEDSSFDLVFSERGPMGYNDITLREALRALRPGGLLFIETIGEANSWETRQAFEPGFIKPQKLTGNLEAEGARLERHDVQIQTLASRVQTIEFNSMLDWLRYQVYSWSPPHRDAFTEENLPAIHEFENLASTPNGRVCITSHTIWLAGTSKSGRD